MAAFGERRVDHVQPVAHPLGFAVSDQHDLHGRRLYGHEAPLACDAVANDGGARPGWYPDPIGRFEFRYHNGALWTADVSTNGERFVDPLGVGVQQHGVQSARAGEADSPSTSLATASMVLGIVAVAIAWIPFVVVIGAIAALSALVLGVLAIRRSGPSGAGRSRAIVGLITGGSGLLAAALGTVLTFVVLAVSTGTRIRRRTRPSSRRVRSTDPERSPPDEIENLDDDTSDFTVLIAFTRPGTDNPHRSTRVTLDDVAPGASAPIRAERQVELDDVDCIVIEVTGPLPFGLALD